MLIILIKYEDRKNNFIFIVELMLTIIIILNLNAYRFDTNSFTLCSIKIIRGSG